MFADPGRYLCVPVSRLFAALLAALLAGVLAGCGGPPSNGEAKKPARQIITDASQATSSARSVRVTGKGTVNNLAVQLDIVDGPGRGGGSITIGGSTVQMVLDRPRFYLKTTPEVVQQLTGSQQAAAQDANRWLQTSASDSSIVTLTPLLDISQLPSTSVAFAGIPTRQRITSFRGHQAIPVADPLGGDTVYVAATGKPYILGIKGAGRTGGSTLSFTDYDHARVPAPPPSAVTLAPPGS